MSRVWLRKLAPSPPCFGADAELLEGAAWLHDIGYSPELVDTFHPLDGARYLRDVCHADEKLCGLVAHHSYDERQHVRLQWWPGSPRAQPRRDWSFIRDAY
jgi:hypothetical protein